MSKSINGLLQSYLLSRHVGQRYRESLTRTVKKATAAGLTSVSDLKPEVVNRFLQNLSTPSPTTQANIRRELLTLWRWAVEEGLTDTIPMRVMRIKARPAPPQAWSLAELSRMLDCAEQDDTRIGGVSELRVRDYMPCWISIAYDSALRFSDMLALHSSQVRNGHVFAIAQKTGKSLVRPLSPYSLQCASKVANQSIDGTMFSWFLTRRRALVTMRAFFDRHGFVGSGKYLRRSCATYIESQHPGLASRYLQHSAPHLVGKHYLDESLLAAPVGPPPIRSLNSGAR